MRLFALFFVLLSCLLSCRKDVFINDSNAKLTFSSDTILFDTVWVSRGSTVKQVRIANTYNKSIKISSIQLQQNDGTFRLNVDGVAGNYFTEIEILPNDSIYVFVTCTVDPNSSVSPFLIEDKIVFLTNGNTQEVSLQAYGQNAIYHNRESITTNTTWTALLPHVIVDYVYVDSLTTLHIDAGTKIHTFGNFDDPYLIKGRLLVGGTLISKGNKDSLVTFTGARLEQAFNNSYSQWNGIEFLPGSRNSILNFTQIKNATLGLKLDTLPPLSGQYTLQLNQCELSYIGSSAIVATTAKMKATNVLVHHCLGQAVVLAYGGDYHLNHCTLAYGSDKGLLGISNYLQVDISTFLTAPLQALVQNSIVWGNNANEFVVAEEAGSAVSYQFDNCILKTENILDSHYSNCTNNTNPLFVKDNESPFDFSLQSNSPCIDVGLATGVTLDLLGNTRGALVDVGCYEFM